MSLDIFRKKLREYCHLAGRSQQQLAEEVGLHLTTLSRKLNQSGTARLSNLEVKQIIKVLAEWGGINTQSEAVELLELMGLTYKAFSDQEWHSTPLNLLEIEAPPVELPTKPGSTKAPQPVEKTEPAKTALKEVPTASPPLYISNLPFSVTSFVGREKELGEITDLLNKPHVRLVTLSGPGGVGKTRLALQIIHQLRPSFEHGVCFVSLGALHDPELVATSIVAALGSKEAVSKKTTDQTITFLKDFLRDKRLLLVLDNFEQLNEAAPLLTELIAEAPGLKLLVTSRAVLHLYGEHEFVVPPLALPDPKQATIPALLARNEAVSLFVQRAQAVKQEFGLNSNNGPLLAEICTRLDGLPLAIELAAARTKLLSPQMLLDRLNRRLALLTGGAANLPARHQTLRNAIDWSYDLLERNDKQLFRHIAVFEGGCNLEAAATVLNQSDQELLEGISSLLDKSMLRQIEEMDGQPRYIMLSTIREYGLEQLVENGEEANLRQQHAAFFLDLAEQAALEGPQQARWLDRLESEHDNFLAVLDWALEILKNEADKPLFNNSIRPASHLYSRYLHPGEIALRLGSALWRFWWLRGYLSDGRRRLEATLAQFQPRTSEDERIWFNEIRVKALHAAGTLAYYQGDFDGAVAFFQESLSLGQTLKSKPIIARALQDLGMVGVQRGDFQSAREQYLQSMVLHQELKNKAGTAASLLKLAGEEVRLGNFEQALKHYRESLALWHEVGDKSSIALTIKNQGELVAGQGDYAQARRLLEQSLSLSQELRDRPGISALLNSLGLLAAKTGNYAEARALLQESLSLKEQLGDRSGLAMALGNLGSVATSQGKLEEALTHLERSVALKRELGEWPSLNLSLNSQGYLEILLGHFERAETLLNESLEVGNKFGDKLAVAGTYLNLGLLEYRQANYALAGKNLLSGLTISQEVGAKHSIATDLAWLAILAGQTGRFEPGISLAGGADKLLKETGGVLEPYQQTEYERAIAAFRLQIDEPIYINLLSQGQTMTTQELVELCQVLVDKL